MLIIRYQLHIYQFAIIVFLLLTNEIMGQIDIPVTIKNINSYSVNNFPVSFTVPLPKSTYYETNNIGIYDPASGSVPAQIDVLNRHTALDNSIRHILVTTKLDIGSYGSHTINVREGVSNQSTELKVQDGANEIIVNTGK